MSTAITVQEIMTAAADENGEWYLPLTPEQVGQPLYCWT
jgi:hypothetical protein